MVEVTEADREAAKKFMQRNLLARPILSNQMEAVLRNAFAAHRTTSLAAHNGLVAALQDMTDHYVRLIDSGDAGSWNPRDEPVVQRALAALSARVETLEAGMSQYLKDGQTPLERMEQDQADILGLMKLLQKEKELTEKLRWALSDAVTTNTESCRERDAALHRIEAARLGIIEGLKMAAKVAEDWDMDWTANAGENIQRIAAAIRALIEEQKV